MNDISLNVRGIAHDLNNQIMILMNALDRVMVLCPEEPDALSAVKAAEHCAMLTNLLLPQTGQRSLPAGSASGAAVDCSVKEIVSEAAMLVRPLLPEFNRIEVVCRADCHIHAPSADIQRALVNLCINAVDAMDGPGVVRLEAEQVGASVILSVRDTGPGVPVELRERIFEPLFTTKNPAGRGHGGSGLGLSRVRETVEQSGGTISVTNVFPQGAWFRIVLPAL